MTTKKLAFALLALLALFSTQNAVAQNDSYCVSTPNTTLMLRAKIGEELKILYYGNRISSSEYDAVVAAGALDCNAYPAFGMHCMNENAISVRHADGNLILQLFLQSIDTRPENNASVTVFHLKDGYYPFFVDVCYRAYNNNDIIETWVEISHKEKQNVTLAQFASGYMPLRQGNVWMLHEHGEWGNEAQITTERMTPGMKVIRNTDGVRNTHLDHPEIMFSLNGKPQENNGSTIGAALCWSGNYKLRIETDNRYFYHFFAGINEDNSEYHLAKDEKFTTPELAFTYSEEGTSGVSRNFHNWARRTHLHNGEATRKVLLNSWEGVYFDVNQPKMEEMMHDISYLGGEMFVMDDGWFGEKYQRNDSQALGDWNVDKIKLPNGIKALTDAAHKENIDFGLWIEPEMTNTISELYEKHPDWAIAPAHRDPIKGRGGSQMVLDMSNPKVQDFVVSVVDNIMIPNPDVKYIKWDANMSIFNYASPFLPGDKQSHLYINYHKGLINTLKRIRAKYPDLVIQDCASGGGRVNYGLLPYFDEFWASDVTDALERIYIQWGTSHFFPANAMACHVSASPNHQTGRIIPIKFRFDVAMQGRLGMEIQPSQMNKEDYEFSKRAIASYKQIRSIVQLGDLYRILSPYENNFASLLYASQDKSKAVFFSYKVKHTINQMTPIFKMAGLNADKHYRITELNKADVNNKMRVENGTYSGEMLMSTGIWLDLDREYSSRVLLLEQVD